MHPINTTVIHKFYNTKCEARLNVVDFFISIDPYRITHPLDMENGYNNTRCTNIYNIQSVSAI